MTKSKSIPTLLTQFFVFRRSLKLIDVYSLLKAIELLIRLLWRLVLRVIGVASFLCLNGSRCLISNKICLLFIIIPNYFLFSFSRNWKIINWQIYIDIPLVFLCSLSVLNVYWFKIHWVIFSVKFMGFLGWFQ
jgi:hypothetical protein